MNELKQNLAIAEAVGWSHIKNANTMAPMGIWIGYPPKGAIVGKPALLPNFLLDLNAMHAAENACVITEDQEDTWAETLRDVCSESGDSIAGNATAMRATAKQRAEALLRFLNKWKDE